MPRKKHKTEKNKPRNKAIQQSKEEPLKKKSNFFRKVLLFLISSFLTIGFAYLPINKRWIDSRIKPYYQQIPSQWERRDLETRKKDRWGYDYNMPLFLKKHLDSNSVFLLPPQSYLVARLFNKENQQTHLWINPSLLYYHYDFLTTVDLKSNEEELKKATHTLFVSPSNELHLVSLNETNLHLVIQEFEKFEYKNFYYSYQVSNWLKENKQ